MTPLVDATAAAEIAERFRNRNSFEMPDDCEVGVVAKPRKYRYIRPFSDAAEDLIDICQNTDGRWMFGIQSIDAMTRGLGRGELMYVTGRAHSGKTQLCLQSIANNPNAHVMLFTPDEVDVLVLSKLVSIVRGIDGEQLEHRIRNNDAHTIDIVRRCAADDFRNMIVIDQSLTFDQMTVALKEAREYWGCREDVTMVDFLELMPGDGAGNDSVVGKSQGMKAWGKGNETPLICLHQASRSSGARGTSAGMNAMRYGGETEATFVLEVFRKLEDTTLEEWERDLVLDTVTVNVAKNKRPPSKKGEVDLFMDPNTGAIRMPKPGDTGVRATQALPSSVVAVSRTAELLGTYAQQKDSNGAAG